MIICFSTVHGAFESMVVFNLSGDVILTYMAFEISTVIPAALKLKTVSLNFTKSGQNLQQTLPVKPTPHS